METEMPRPAYFKIGHGQDRYGSRHVTTFLFRDEAQTNPIGWQHGVMKAGETFKDGGGNVFTLVEVSAQAARAA
jgi:hypothetical protein